VAANEAPLRLVHLITSLNVGGAQMHLYKTVTRFRPDKIASTVVSLVPGGKIAELLRSQGVSVLDLGMRPGCVNLRALFQLTGLLRRLRPHMVQTYLYHADLLGYMASKRAHVASVLWNLRQSRMDFSRYPRTTGLTVRLCARLSRGVKRILVNSYAGLKAHALLGYDASRMLVVPNGFELTRFRPHTPSYQEVRQELGLGPEARLVGMLARFDPQKDHETFLRAAQLVSKRLPEAFFLLAGNGLNYDNPAFARLLAANPISPERLRILGERYDTPRLMAALDVYVSSSAFGEGFANAIGEAMACGVPCAVTDVGDSAFIVGETGLVVQPRQPQDLSRARMQEKFDINRIVAQLESFYLDLAAQSAAPGLMELCQLST
jgi:glycosyltransferase involved in cell wall biosynthesis